VLFAEAVKKQLDDTEPDRDRILARAMRELASSRLMNFSIRFLSPATICVAVVVMFNLKHLVASLVAQQAQHASERFLSF
jgi:S-ribosylhomocysteine lyase LuxS involved in autoinducer biosynthesis